MKKVDKIKEAQHSKDVGTMFKPTIKIFSEINEISIPLYQEREFKLEGDIIYKGKVVLDKFLLINKDFKQKILGKNLDFVNLFFMNKNFLYVYLLETKLDPGLDNYTAYTTKEFDIYSERLKTVRPIKIDTDKRIKILEVEDNKCTHYVLKRSWHHFDVKLLNEKESINCLKFMINKYTEYGLVKLYNACPFSAKPAGFHIVYIVNQGKLVTEMLTVFSGKTISTIFPVKDCSKILELFSQILYAANFLEVYKIEHNDIKPDNLLFEIIEDIPLIRLIDFDIGNNQEEYVKTNESTGYRGYSPGYVAPEILQVINSYFDQEMRNKEFSKINPWKCHSYSIGILMLVMLEYIENNRLLELDNLKSSPDIHNLFLKNLDVDFEKESNIILKKIFILIKKCIIFSPQERASVKEILTLMDKIDTKNLEDIEMQWIEIFNKREMTRNDLKLKLKESDDQIEQLKKKYSLLNEEKHAFVEFFRIYFPKENINLNTNLETKLEEFLDRNKFELENNKKELAMSDELIKETMKKNQKLYEKMAKYKKNLQKKEEENKNLNQTLTEKIKIIENQNNLIINIQKENEDLKNCLNERKNKIKTIEEEINNCILENKEMQHRLEFKDTIIGDQSKEIYTLRNELEKNKSLLNKCKIKEEEIKEKLSSDEETISEYKNFTSEIQKTLLEKRFRFNFQNLSLKRIQEIISEFLPTNLKIPKTSECPVCKYFHDYFDMKICLMKSNKLRKNVYERIEYSDEFWDFNGDEIQINEITLISPLIMTSTRIELIDFGNNSYFDLNCVDILLQSLQLNDSIKGIAFYNNSNEISIQNYIDLLDLSINKKNIICLYFDTKIMKVEIAISIAEAYQMEINNKG